MAAEPYFKKGDIIRPISNRKSSNDKNITKLVRLKVSENVMYKNSYFNGTIIEGTVRDTYYGGDHKVGALIGFYANAFELINKVDADYEIF